MCFCFTKTLWSGDQSPKPPRRFEKRTVGAGSRPVMAGSQPMKIHHDTEAPTT